MTKINKQEDRLSLNPTKIREKGKYYLGVPLGQISSKFGLKKVFDIKDAVGWIVKKEKVEQWRFIGYCKKDDNTYLYGPYSDGTLLSQKIQEPHDVSLPRILELVDALLLLKGFVDPLFNISLDSVILLKKGGVLFLPEKIIRQINYSKPQQYRNLNYEVINHPEKSGEQNLCFTIANLVYHIIIGTFPFIDQNELEIRNKIRFHKILHPVMIKPELKVQVSAVIEKSLVPQKEDIITLTTWQNNLKAWLTEGLFRKISKQEKEAILKKAERKARQYSNLFEITLFLHKNLGRLLIGSAVAIVCLVIIISILLAVLEPRQTKGFSPEQVVKAYYDAITRLDHDMMSDCVVGDVNQGEINQVVHLYVTVKQEIAYQGESSIITTDTWDQMGRPRLSPPIKIYGVLDLMIQEERDEPETVFIVSYKKWMPDSSSINEQGTANRPLYIGYKMRDRVFLKKDNEDWVIYKNERLLEESIKID